jgi:hypothetical protein
MSLQVWFPLNGTLENKGLSNVKMVSTDAPIYTDNGKIGKALSTGGATMPAAMTAKVLNNKTVSIAC